VSVAWHSESLVIRRAAYDKQCFAKLRTRVAELHNHLSIWLTFDCTELCSSDFCRGSKLEEVMNLHEAVLNFLSTLSTREQDRSRDSSIRLSYMYDFTGVRIQTCWSFSAIPKAGSSTAFLKASACGR
jgi:hypothetical protein